MKPWLDRGVFFHLLIALWLPLVAGSVFALEAGRDNPERGTGYTQQSAVFAGDFMVVAAHPLAARAGYNLLRKGGSAIDAAIAVQAVLTLVEPQSSGIGGGAFILHHDGVRLTTYDGRETAPDLASSELFMGAGGKPVPWIEAVVGGRSVGVPGVLKALSMAHRRHGKLPWASLFDEAIELAQTGFTVSPRFAALVEAEFNPGLRRLTPARDYFFPQGKPLRPGDLLKNPQLAQTLRLIAGEGADAFYKGPLASSIVGAVRNSEVAPGVLSLEDLDRYRARERAAICVQYRGYDVCSMGPPSAGGIAVLQQLALLEPFELDFDGRPSPSALHLITQASRLAFADRDRYIADSDFVPVPVSRLIDAAYLRKRRRLINLTRDMDKAPPGHLSGFARVDGNAYELPSTSHLSIVDRYGNALAMTSSIEMAHGSAVMTNGFLLNNQLTDFSLSPRRGDSPVANRVQPGKRPRSSMAPVIVLKDNRPVLLLGSPGGGNIINYVTQTLLGVLHWNLNIQQAVAMPKISNRNGKTMLEKSTYLEDQRGALEALGHSIEIGDLNSGLHAIHRVGSGWMAGVDHRREGRALGE